MRTWIIVLGVALGLCPGATAQTTWVAAAAHAPGVEGSTWRTELGVLNSCEQDATVEIVLHDGASEPSESFTVLGGTQQIFDDVVAQLTSEDAEGALEVRSTVGVTVTSRTYNLAPSGTFGQALDGVSWSDGLAQGDAVYLQQLKQNDTFRTNIGVLNMGTMTLRVGVTLYDRLGDLVGSYELDVPAGRTVQDNRPFSARFGRDDILGGFARLSVESGAGAWAYASVIDGRTGDPTTVTAKPAPQCPQDVAERLAEIEGMEVQELATAHAGYRYFRLRYEQPADHDDPGAGSFDQLIYLLHRSEAAPLVLETLGYHNTWEDRRAELTLMLEANQLVVEHRFFSGSTPSPADWELLDIRQAAADHHRVVEALQPIYHGAWVSTGHSKGGMTALFHRRFYPDDVDATVPYVAPISFGIEDERYVDFLESVGEQECRDDLQAFQREALGRRSAMLARLRSLAAAYGMTFVRVGGEDAAFESALVELPFTFWQYYGETYCSQIPNALASDQRVFDFIADFSSFWYPTDFLMDYFASYFYQAHTEFGYPVLPSDHLADLLQTNWLNLEAGLPPEGATIEFDPQVMPDVVQWVDSEGSRLMFIYGENDPWTARAVELGSAVDSYVYTAEAGTHGTLIADLGQADHAAALANLERWTGVIPAKALPDTALAEARPRLLRDLAASSMR